MTPRLRVALDARYLSHGLVGGVHTYLRSLTEALVARDELDLTLWIDTKAPLDLPPLARPVDVRVLPWTSPLSSARNDLLLKRAVASSGAELVHYPANYGFSAPWVPAVITLHDAINLYPLPRIWRSHPKQPKALLAMTYLHLLTTRAIRQRPHVVTVSEYSRREILRVSGLPPERVTVIPSAHDPVFRRLAPDELAGVRERHALAGQLVLADAIKNPACVLRAWRALPEDARAGATLAFFARREPEPFVRAAASAGECRLLLRPERAELVRLFNLADAFVFPSWYEGFGLPALEAMACGAPVIASDRGSLPEVVGDAGIVVDAEDHATIAHELAAILRQPERRGAMRERSLVRAAGFSWERTARETARVYLRAAGRVPGSARPALDAVAAD